ncbi:hypothetical protein J6590_007635 [Homalodisca vitripennis]|nr:hypothetical protein J6590_007635 [Homalodisca vitripennis]
MKVIVVRWGKGVPEWLGLLDGGRGFSGKSRSLSAACLFLSQSLCTPRTTARRKTSSHGKRRKGSARDYKHRYNSPSPSARDLNNVSALKEQIAMLENSCCNRSARDSKHRYNSPSPSARDLNNVSALKERIAMLENMLETQKDKYKTRIAQLEKEVAAMGKSGNNLNEELNEHSRKVSDNVEIIKLRRDGKKLSKDIDILNDQNDALRKELEELKVALKKANESVAELERILEREREKARDAESNLSKSMSNTETIRALQEEIRDLKNERKELKEANEQLLLLTTTPPKSDRSGSESKLKQQVSTLELKLREKSKELEDMKREVARLEALVKGSDNTPKS